MIDSITYLHVSKNHEKVHKKKGTATEHEVICLQKHATQRILGHTNCFKTVVDN